MMQASPSAARGTTVRIFLADGTPDGLRVVEKSNWTGIALMCARVQYPDVRKRAELDRPCVYVLIGASEENIDRQQIYIGQADIGRHRIDKHVSNKDFWTHLIVFTSKDSNLNRAHVQYLESRLIQIATQTKRADLTNGNVPNAPSLSEADIADVESFLEDMLTVYPLLGVTAFEQIEQPHGNTPKTEDLALKRGGTSATGFSSPQGFVVRAGSLGRPNPSPNARAWVIAFRSRLLESGVLVQEAEAVRFTQDYLFRSPSTAAAVLLGRNAHGPELWVDRYGRSLKELEGDRVKELAGVNDETPTDQVEEE